MERDLRRTRGQRLSREGFVFSIGEGTEGERARHCAAAALRQLQNVSFRLYLTE